MRNNVKLLIKTKLVIFKSTIQSLFFLITKSSLFIHKKTFITSLISLIFTSLITALPANAAVTYSAAKTVVTKNYITGSAPYLTFDGGVTKETDTASLLTIKLSDELSYNIDNNESSVTNPIEIPEKYTTFADIKMFIPDERTSVNLSELIGEPNNYWGDDEGDGQGINGITVTGNLSLKIEDPAGHSLKRNDKITVCEPYYKLTLTASSGSLKTTYGAPNTLNFTAADAVYYITKAPTKPITCYAKPHMNYSGSNNPMKFSNIDGPFSQWDPDKGFKPQNIDIPSSNFPTMGAYGLFFNLTMTGSNVNWQNVTYDKSPSSSGIDIRIGEAKEGKYNVAELFLTGPRYTDIDIASTAVPTTFTIYADKAKQNKIYSFTIKKWFIPTYETLTANSSNPEGINYCSNRYGSRYRTPLVTEYTNGNKVGVWTGGLAGQPNNYQRRIGGGLFAEWGQTADNTNNPINNPVLYTESNFGRQLDWTCSTKSENEDSCNILVSSYYGGLYNMVSSVLYQNSCVTK